MLCVGDPFLHCMILQYHEGIGIRLNRYDHAIFGGLVVGIEVRASTPIDIGWCPIKKGLSFYKIFLGMMSSMI